MSERPDVNYPLGWFADIATEDKRGPDGKLLWEACIQIPGAIFTLDGIWFNSEEDCLDFIREDILGKGLIDEPAPTREPAVTKEYFDEFRSAYRRLAELKLTPTPEARKLLERDNRDRPAYSIGRKNDE